MNTIAKNIALIQQNIKQIDAHHPIDIIGVSKRHSVDAIRQAYDAGITHFGENYWQEAREKIAALADLPITWHFIGAIQTNKAKKIAENVSWVHCLDRFKTAEHLSNYRTSCATPLNVCIQVNLDKEINKAGIVPEDVIDFAQRVCKLPQLKLRGLMAIPKLRTSFDDQYHSFLRLNNMLQHCSQQLAQPLDTLSMGMSNDYLAAINAGSTQVRIGRAIFGERD